VQGIGISDRDGSAAFIDSAALDLTAPRDEHGDRRRPTPNERLAGALSRSMIAIGVASSRDQAHSAAA
jgi:hypothetical protein